MCFHEVFGKFCVFFGATPARFVAIIETMLNFVFGAAELASVARFNFVSSCPGPAGGTFGFIFAGHSRVPLLIQRMHFT